MHLISSIVCNHFDSFLLVHFHFFQRHEMQTIHFNLGMPFLFDKNFQWYLSDLDVINLQIAEKCISKRKLTLF